MSHTTTSFETAQETELRLAVESARAACPDCAPPARQMHPGDNEPVPCHYCHKLTYGRTNGRGVCTDCLVTLPRVIADFFERVNAGRI